MSSATDERLFERRKMTSTADLIRRGASLLNEPCPRCGGVQIRFKGKVYCVNEDDLDAILSSPEQQERPPEPRREATVEPIVQPISGESQDGHHSPPGTLSSATPERIDSAQLKRTLEEKLGVISRQLETSQDFDQQARLLDLISRYLETLEKLKRAS